MARRARPPQQRAAQPSNGTAPQQISVQARVDNWSGPLPPPAALQAFEEIAPGTADKIVAQFQTEAEHRRDMERAQARLTIGETFLGQGSAIVFALAALGVAGYSAYVGAEWIGSIVGGGVIVSGILALRGKQQPKK